MTDITTYQDVWSLILNELKPIELIPLQLVNKKLHDYIGMKSEYINKMDFLLGCMEYKLIESHDDYLTYVLMKQAKQAEYRIYCRSTDKPIPYERYVGARIGHYVYVINYYLELEFAVVQFKINQFGFTITQDKIKNSKIILTHQDKNNLTSSERFLIENIDGEIFWNKYRFNTLDLIH